ncbi:hypothetical protein PSE305_42170 [Pseudomonas aeruginosa]|nr:hypothetical protein PSE305_42170 [Pseudomonas aeruginosa]
MDKLFTSIPEIA